MNPRQLPVACTLSLVLLTNQRRLPGRRRSRIRFGMKLRGGERCSQTGAGAPNKVPPVHAGVGIVSHDSGMIACVMKNLPSGFCAVLLVGLVGPLMVAPAFT